MNFDINVILFVFVASCCQGTHSDVTVSPLSITVLEGNNATARCIYDGENSLQGVTFSLNQSTIATLYLPNCTLNTLGLDNYITDCDGNKTVVITLVNVSRNDHGKTLTCTVYVYNSSPIQSSSSTLLTVNVPVKKVTITSENAIDGLVSVCEKTTLNFRCKTSAVRPIPNISWIFQNKLSAKEISIVGSITLEKDENHLDIAFSTLNITSNSSLNIQMMFCSASNILDKEVNSSNIHFNISYPPVESPSILNLSITNGDTYSIIEGRQGLLTCAVPKSKPVANLSWNGLNNRQDIEKTIVTNRLEWRASRQDTNISTCIAKHHCHNYERSISIMIKVLYPPIVKSMKDVSIVEGSMLNITCSVILGIPKAATFKWTRQKDIFIRDSQLLMIGNISRDSSSNYTCTVTNIMNPTIGIEEKGESSGSFEINVLYPPTVDSIENFTIIEGSHFNLSCPVNPGNPDDTNINWSASGNILQSATKILSFHNVSRKHDMIYTCTVSNIMKPTDSNEVKGINREDFHLIVEYPPTVKSMKDISIIEGSMLNITCNVTLGKPKTSAFRWTRREDIPITNSQLLMISNISRDLSSNYTCTVANIMKPTYDNEVRGESSKSIYIDVLYPPTVESIKDFSVTEGSNFSLSCPVNPGNPNITNIAWSANGNIIKSGTKVLSFHNVSRKHDMIYTCTVSNIMKPTGNEQEKGTHSESFHLVVEYSATIDEFFIKGHKDDRNVTLNEHDNVTFTCSVVSNPVSTIAIKRIHGGNLITANLNNVAYNLGPADCLDAGTYECSGRNKHNLNQDASRVATILVKCSPRAHPLVLFQTNFTTALNVPVVIKFTALSFPLPTNVLWQKFKDYNWTNITSSKAVSIRNAGLNFSLTIHNVGEKDLGQYRLFIANGIGQFEQQFKIVAVSKRNQDVESSRNASLIGGVVGSIIAILAILVAIFIFRRKVISKRKLESHIIYQNDIGATPQSSNSITEYEKIQMHQHKVRKPTGACSSDTDNTFELQYERLDQRTRNSNDYSQISRHCIELDVNRKGKNTFTLSMELKEDTDVPIYTNLKI